MTSIAPVMEPQSAPELDLRRYIEIVRRRRVVIVIVLVGTVGLALLFSAAQTPVYEARTRLLLRSSAGDQLLGANNSNATDVATEIQVMQSEPVRQAVAEELGRRPSVRFSTVDETNVVIVTARADDAKRAAEDANGFAQGYINWRLGSGNTTLTDRADRLRTQQDTLNAQLTLAAAPLQAVEDQLAALPPTLPGEDASPERQALQEERDRVAAATADERNAIQARVLANQQELSQVEQAISFLTVGGNQILSSASPPSTPLTPRPMRNAVLGLMVGLIGGIIVALALEMLDDRIRRKEDLVTASGGRSVIGFIPVVGKPRKRGRGEATVISIDSPSSPAAEAYRTLRTSIQFLSVDEPIRLIQVTSPNPAEGKTTTVANLGVALARAGQRVVVVCCDLRRPRIHEFYGVDNAVGFTSVLLGDATLEKAVQDVEGEPRLQILASGPPPPNPAEMLSAKRTRDVLTALAEYADVVIVDTPPVLPVTDSLVMSGLVDVTILVAKADSTDKRAVRRAVELLDQVDANLVGCVLNGAPLGGPYGYGTNYGYGYGSYEHRTASRNGSDRQKAKDVDAPVALDQTT